MDRKQFLQKIGLGAVVTMLGWKVTDGGAFTGKEGIKPRPKFIDHDDKPGELDLLTIDLRTYYGGPVNLAAGESFTVEGMMEPPELAQQPFAFNRSFTTNHRIGETSQMVTIYARRAMTMEKLVLKYHPLDGLFWEVI